MGPQDTFDSMAQNGQGLFQSSPSSYVNSVPDNLGTELARKAIEIDGLSRSVYKQKKMINGLNVSVMTKNQEISDYKAIVDSQASEIADLEAQLEVLKDEVLRLFEDSDDLQRLQEDFSRLTEKHQALELEIFTVRKNWGSTINLVFSDGTPAMISRLEKILNTAK